MSDEENPDGLGRASRHMQQWFNHEDGRLTWIVWGDPLPPPSALEGLRASLRASIDRLESDHTATPRATP